MPGRKKLDELAQVLGPAAKPPVPLRATGYSNWGDGSSVCGMVTFKDGKPYKAGYRKFKMKTVAGTDDYASLAETVSRRRQSMKSTQSLPKRRTLQQLVRAEAGSAFDGRRQGAGESAAKDALAGTASLRMPPLRHGEGRPPPHSALFCGQRWLKLPSLANRGTFTLSRPFRTTHRFANAYRGNR